MYISKEFIPLQRTTPLEAGIAPVTLRAFSDALSRSSARMRGFDLLCHGKLVAERYWEPYAHQDRVWVYSISKSFTSTAVGLAVDEGRLSIDDKVLPFFPEQAPAVPGKNLAAMRVRDLLSMSTGHEGDTMSVMSAPDGDWVKAFLALPVEHTPGTHFIYNSVASFMLAAIVQKLTSLPILEYLGTRLFEPLGFADVEWDQSPLGIATGGWGILVCLEDLAKLGQLYLNKGMWGKKRILSEEWVREATSTQEDNSKGENQSPDWIQGYGFQFWRCQHGAFRADGAAGQFSIVMPEQDVVLAIMSETPNMQEILDIVWDVLLPGIGNTASETEQIVDGKTYAIAENPIGFTAGVFRFVSDALELTLTKATGSVTIKAGRGEWAESTVLLPLGLASFIPMTAMRARPQRLSAHFEWTASDTLEISWVYRETPHRDKLVCKFITGGMEITCPPNDVAKYMGIMPVQLTGRV